MKKITITTPSYNETKQAYTKKEIIIPSIVKEDKATEFGKELANEIHWCYGKRLEIASIKASNVMKESYTLSKEEETLTAYENYCEYMNNLNVDSEPSNDNFIRKYAFMITSMTILDYSENFNGGHTTKKVVFSDEFMIDGKNIKASYLVNNMDTIDTNTTQDQRTAIRDSFNTLLNCIVPKSEEETGYYKDFTVSLSLPKILDRFYSRSKTVTRFSNTGEQSYKYNDLGRLLFSVMLSTMGVEMGLEVKEAKVKKNIISTITL